MSDATEAATPATAEAAADAEAATVEATEAATEAATAQATVDGDVCSEPVFEPPPEPPTEPLPAPPPESPAEAPPKQQSAFYCPITQELMRDPVVTADGQTYEREAIEKWLVLQQTRQLPGTSPLTGEPLAHTNLVPNVALRVMIRETHP